MQDLAVDLPPTGTSSLEPESLAIDKLESLGVIDNNYPLVIPYSASIAALEGRPFSKPSDATARAATKLGAAANDPAVMGMRANYRAVGDRRPTSSFIPGPSKRSSTIWRTALSTAPELMSMARSRSAR